MLPTLTTRTVSRALADARLDQLLDAYLLAYADYVDEHDLAVNICVPASRITSAVLAHFGINGAVPVGVDLVVAHPSAASLVASGPTPRELPRNVDAVAFMGTDAMLDDGWSGHVVTYVQALQGRRKARLVDPTAAQFSAPDLGIDVAGHVVDATDEFLRGKPLVTSTNGAIVWRKRNARLDGFRGELVEQPFIDEIAAELAAVVADATRPLEHRAA